jgi:hypothetical protein
MTAVERKEEAARNVGKINPAYMSQTCSTCGTIQDMPLSVRVDVSSTCSLITGIQIVLVSIQQVVVIDQELILLTGELFSRLDLPCTCAYMPSWAPYADPRLAGKIAPISQRKGKKIPIIPSRMYPFLNVSRHTVKRQTM